MINPIVNHITVMSIGQGKMTSLDISFIQPTYVLFMDQISIFSFIHIIPSNHVLSCNHIVEVPYSNPRMNVIATQGFHSIPKTFSLLKLVKRIHNSDTVV